MSSERAVSSLRCKRRYNLVRLPVAWSSLAFSQLFRQLEGNTGAQSMLSIYGDTQSWPGRYRT